KGRTLESRKAGRLFTHSIRQSPSTKRLLCEYDPKERATPAPNERADPRRARRNLKAETRLIGHRERRRWRLSPLLPGKLRGLLIGQSHRRLRRAAAPAPV